MATVSATRPDPRYYVNIVQYDDGNYAADPMPLDDVEVSRGTATLLTPGLRSLTKNSIKEVGLRHVYSYAPPYLQSDANNVIAELGSQTGLSPEDQQKLDAARAMWTWINECRDFSDAECSKVDSMTFNNIIVYVVPVATAWPQPPASLPPVPPAMQR